MYGYNTKNKKDKKEFDQWYDNLPKNAVFNFQKEMFEYCFTDVELLARGCMLYRKLFIDISGEDPFQYITIAQLCTKIYKHMIPEKTIGIIKNNSFTDNQSMKAIKWLEHIRNTQNISIQHALSGGEVRVQVPSKNMSWKFDGFDKENNHAYEFHGCYFHGCPKCYPDRNQICRRNNKTMDELYQKTIQREKTIKRYYNLTTIWECEFDDKCLQLNDPCLIKMKQRDAFYGGRTEPIKLYHNFKKLGNKGRYLDVVSLYPTVQNYDEFPIGHPVKIIPKPGTSFNPNWFGIMRCKILPPRGLYHPVLPYKQKTNGAHKLLFGLCRTCMNKIDQDCSHQTFYEYETREEKTYKKKHCKDCLNYRNEECKHSNEERCLIGS
jgi:G:T-mismatch repair DNA endonuclease (very short patch repair protein)